MKINDSFHLYIASHKVDARTSLTSHDYGMLLHMLRCLAKVYYKQEVIPYDQLQEYIVTYWDIKEIGTNDY